MNTGARTRSCLIHTSNNVPHDLPSPVTPLRFLKTVARVGCEGWGDTYKLKWWFDNQMSAKKKLTLANDWLHLERAGELVKKTMCCAIAPSPLLHAVTHPSVNAFTHSLNRHAFKAMSPPLPRLVKKNERGTHILHMRIQKELSE